jgi:hypothetical protein
MSRLRISLPLLLLLAAPAQAQWAVFDAKADLNAFYSLIQQGKDYLALLDQLKNQATQITHQVTQIEHLYTSVRQGATNLQQLPQTLRVGSLADALSLNTRLLGTLQQVEGVSYQATNAFSQAQRLYDLSPVLRTQLSSGTLRTFRQQSLAAQRSTALSAVNLQAIDQDARQRQARLAAILSMPTSGNLDTAQQAVQVQGLTVNQLAAIEAQIAAANRVQALEALQRTTLDEATQQLQAQSYGGLDLSGPPRGRFLTLERGR